MGTDPNTHDYPQPARPFRTASLLTVGHARIAVAALLLYAAFALPHPEGIWYFGRNPQWLVAVQFDGVSIGPVDQPTSLGWLPLIVLKLCVVSVPVWAISRVWMRRKRDGPAS
ncbi:MAG: hypothetical protein QM770_11630 [Tepidisphaeraceae bacterium]